MLVRARISLWSSDRAFRLPASGTPSMLFRFGSEDGELLGGRATSVTGDDFAPGTDHDVRIDLWAEDEARGIVRAGEPFTVWYGGDIGDGVVAFDD